MIFSSCFHPSLRYLATSWIHTTFIQLLATSTLTGIVTKQRSNIFHSLDAYILRIPPPYYYYFAPTDAYAQRTFAFPPSLSHSSTMWINKTNRIAELRRIIWLQNLQNVLNAILFILFAPNFSKMRTETSLTPTAFNIY